MRISDEELLGIVEACSAKGLSASFLTCGILAHELLNARKAIKAYLDWCDNKDGSATIPYKVLDDLRKCVENNT
jgi:hypothetical protein